MQEYLHLFLREIYDGGKELISLSLFFSQAQAHMCKQEICSDKMISFCWFKDKLKNECIAHYGTTFMHVFVVEIL